MLTGTPVENSTLELWSQFAFLNPGLLGNLEYFKHEFATPIESNRATSRRCSSCARWCYPFILRRTKDQVAPELPPRSERTLYSDMEPAQRKLYNRMREYYRGMLLGMLETKGLNDARMKILEGLLRLRQICNHPRLVDEKFRGESAKFELLLETLETLHAEGHKALVFSQFVQMLRAGAARRSTRAASPTPTWMGRRATARRGWMSSRTIAGHPLLPDQPEGGRGGPEPDRRRLRHPHRPVVEPGGGDAGHRPHPPHRAGQAGLRLQAHHARLGGGEDPALQERKKSLVEQLITTESSFFKELTADDVKALFS